ncbi:MAG TPA: response regulator [Novosphingobium sp.]|nr:response regulator [Novosphingobium sp.]
MVSFATVPPQLVPGSDPEAQQPRDFPPLATDRPLDILLVEDDEADAFLICDALRDNQRIGNIVRAHDGVEALEMIENGLAPDLAIIDLQMPRRDGFGLLRDLGERGKVNFPAVIFTSSRGGADAYRCFKRGARMFASKPKQADRFAPLLNEVLKEL